MATALFEAGAADVLYLVDLSSYLLRAYHAVAPLSSPSGEPTHAVHGTITMLERLFRERKPALLAIAMDSGRATFRRELYADYKANRPPAPDDLRVQIRRAEEIIDAWGLATYKQEGVEADDLIASATRAAQRAGQRVVIVGADKDLMQLAAPDVVLWDTLRNKVFGPAEVQERFGVGPERLGDLLALMGDSSDNIPGVPSVGPKTAAELLTQFGDLDGLFARLSEVKRPKLRDTLSANEAAARLSRQLVALKEDCPVDVTPEAVHFSPTTRRDTERLRTLFGELGFSRQLTQLNQSAGEGAGSTATAPGDANVDAPSSPAGGPTPRAKTRAAETQAPRVASSTASSVASSTATARSAPAAPVTLSLVARLSELESFLTTSSTGSNAALVLEGFTTHPERPHGPLLGVALACGQTGVYVPLGHRYVGAPPQLDAAEVVALLAKSLPGRHLVCHDKKRQLVLFDGAIPGSSQAWLASAEDTLLGAYLLDAERRHGLVELAERFGVTVTPFDVWAKEGRRKRDFDELPVDEVIPWAAARVTAVQAARAAQAEELAAQGFANLYSDIELPLAVELSEMEERGVLIDGGRLRELGVACDTELHALEREAYAAAGKEFNVNSPRQLETLLFDELGLKPLKRTKTSRSTDAETLESLSEEHALPDVILRHRSIAKLKGTYIDALPALVRPSSGRVHGTWEQAVAATGRISSTEPNLQNIPIRTELGRKIRAAFVAPPGHLLVSADYSQIELRVLAHLSGDVRLVEAFRSGQDVHLRTAMEIFEKDEADVTREMRAQAKAVNFGVIYGQGESGLSKAVGIPRADAARFIAAYFRRYEGVRSYLDRTLEQARAGHGVTTILGRRRHVPDIQSGNRARRLAAERIAMNMPIQGSAADILKLAMLALRAPVTPGARMVLTVHDELVFEVPTDEVEVAQTRIREAMEGAYSLDVPLTVSVGSGPDWNSAH
ncbi:MAG TPA: DNA polymerase I [Polyangiaceae bacterium]|nr:DNA polymerase I [Polyangiaceae bacterium]